MLHLHCISWNLIDPLLSPQAQLALIVRLATTVHREPRQRQPVLLVTIARPRQPSASYVRRDSIALIQVQRRRVRMDSTVWLGNYLVQTVQQVFQDTQKIIIILLLAYIFVALCISAFLQPFFAQIFGFFLLECTLSAYIFFTF